ncbi:MAG: hypothetical protein ACD_42C00316G0001 [uncultured bacterium]|nr:MAG: hypothetical protein ACD_42C00316G0001 [uncultured bacterium]
MRKRVFFGTTLLLLCSTSFAGMTSTCTTNSCPCTRTSAHQVPSYVYLIFGCTSNYCQSLVGLTPSCTGGTITVNDQTSNYIYISCAIPVASGGGTLVLTKGTAPFITLSTGTPTVVQDTYSVFYMPYSKSCKWWADQYQMSANAALSGTIPSGLHSSPQYNNSGTCIGSSACTGMVTQSYEYWLHP